MKFISILLSIAAVANTAHTVDAGCQYMTIGDRTAEYGGIQSCTEGGCCGDASCGDFASAMVTMMETIADSMPGSGGVLGKWYDGFRARTSSEFVCAADGNFSYDSTDADNAAGLAEVEAATEVCVAVLDAGCSIPGVNTENNCTAQDPPGTWTECPSSCEMDIYEPSAVCHPCSDGSSTTETACTTASGTWTAIRVREARCSLKLSKILDIATRNGFENKYGDEFSACDEHTTEAQPRCLDPAGESVVDNPNGTGALSQEDCLALMSCDGQCSSTVPDTDPPITMTMDCLTESDCTGADHVWGTNHTWTDVAADCGTCNDDDKTNESDCTGGSLVWTDDPCDNQAACEAVSSCSGGGTDCCTWIPNGLSGGTCAVSQTRNVALCAVKDESYEAPVSVEFGGTACVDSGDYSVLEDYVQATVSGASAVTTACSEDGGGRGRRLQSSTSAVVVSMTVSNLPAAEGGGAPTPDAVTAEIGGQFDVTDSQFPDGYTSATPTVAEVTRTPVPMNHMNHEGMDDLAASDTSAASRTSASVLLLSAAAFGLSFSISM